MFADAEAAVVISDLDDTQFGYLSGFDRQMRQVELGRSRSTRDRLECHLQTLGNLLVDSLLKSFSLFRCEIPPDVPEIEIDFRFFPFQMGGDGSPAPEHPPDGTAQEVLGGVHFAGIYFFAHTNFRNLSRGEEIRGCNEEECFSFQVSIGLAPDFRYYDSGELATVGYRGFSWSSTTSGNNGLELNFYSQILYASHADYRTHGFQLRYLSE